MSRKGKYAVPSLLAAGLVPVSGAADTGSRSQPTENQSVMDQFKSIVSNLDQSHEFTLALHRSHQSHGSHGSHSSHQSHRSYGMRLTPDEAPPDVMPAATSSRNEMSTPPNSVLPSSPAIARKLKPLPGNSAKFQAVVQQLQIALLSRGYDVGTVDGEVHARTVAAIYQYQGDSGMVPSGKVTNEVLSSLGIVAQ